ncbi:sensor histidine kinase [Roseivirga sp. UBA838]|uniref:tetratricopeptide repeat-containing sensor histidine kinase n=1 Tax=Roseivirga sp. UBA838 TaxID=1947393 RepID=UPI00257F75EA|nr:sensor histidine kinase [Roseivirga sp. UBA838]
MKKRTFPLTFAYLLLAIFLFQDLQAQTSFTDSLERALKSAKGEDRVAILLQLSKSAADKSEALQWARQAVELSQSDKNKALSLNQVAWSLKNRFEFDSATSYARQALTHAEGLDDALVTSDIYNTFGSIFNNRNQFDSAIYYNELALAKRVEANDLPSQAVSMNNLSIIYQRTADYAKAAQLIDRSIEIYEELGMERSMADSYLNKGNLLTNKGDLDSAYLSFQNSLKAYEKLGLNVMMTYALINMATVAVELDNWDDAEAGYRQSLNILLKTDPNPQLLAFAYNGVGVVHEKVYADADSALHYYSLGADNARQAQSNYLLSISHNNLGSIYADKGDYHKAIEYLESARELKTAMGERSGLSAVYVGLGEAYQSMGNRAKAEENLLAGLKLAEEINELGDRERAYGALYEFYKSGNQYKAALNYLEKMNIAKDSLLNREHLATVADLNIGYETEKKEQQIALQNARLMQQDVELQRNQIVIVSLIIMAVLLVVIVLLVRNRSQKEKALLEQEARLKLREAEINAVIASQEKERNRFARDLHDGFGQLISVLKLNLSQLNETSAKEAEKRYEVFKNGESVINEMYAELRNICFDLMPQTLVKRGLMPALKEFGSRLNQTDQVNCEVLVFANNERLNELVEISLFRITQEWVNNILKYAQADHITIQLIHEDGEVTLTVEDNGNGFDPQIFYRGSGNGWKNIQTRLNQIKGEFDIDSRPGVRGTMMTVVVETRKKHSDIPTSTEKELTS